MTTARKNHSINADPFDKQIVSIDGSVDENHQLADHLLKNVFLTDKQIQDARCVQVKLKTAQGIATFDKLQRSLARLQNPRPMAELKRI